MIWSISVILKPFKTLAIVYYQVKKFAGFASRFLNLIIHSRSFFKTVLILLWSYRFTIKLRKPWTPENYRNVDFVYWPITIKFRIRKQTSKPQTNYRCCLRFSYLAPYWLISRNTITFHKYFSCSRFRDFHSNIIGDELLLNFGAKFQR